MGPATDTEWINITTARTFMRSKGSLRKKRPTTEGGDADSESDVC